MKKRLLTLALCVGTIVSTNSCALGQREIAFTTGYTSLYLPDDTEAQFGFAHTFDEWHSFRTERDYLAELDTKYTDEYFKEKSLFIYATLATYSLVELRITRFYRENRNLTIHISIVYGDSSMVTTGLVIIEVKSADVKGINSYTLHKTIT